MGAFLEEGPAKCSVASEKWCNSQNCQNCGHDFGLVNHANIHRRRHDKIAVDIMTPQLSNMFGGANSPILTYLDKGEQGPIAGPVAF